MHFGWYAWAAFIAFVVSALLLNLLVFRRRPGEVSPKQAVLWSLVWIGVSLTFAAILFAVGGWEIVQQFLAAYLIEKTLSVDNIFLFVVIFSSFSIPESSQVRVLLWGVLGAIVLRGSFVLGGFTLLKAFRPASYVFGGLLLVAAVQALRHRDGHVDPAQSRPLRLVRRFVPMTEGLHGDKL